MLAWGMDAIKNIQKHVGIPVDDGDGDNEDRIKVPHPSQGGRHVDFFDRKADVHINTESFSPPVSERGAVSTRNIEGRVGSAGHSSKRESNVSFLEPSISASKASSQFDDQMAERELLAKARRRNQAKLAKLGEELVAARFQGHDNDSSLVKAIKSRLLDLRLCAQEQEHQWTHLEDTIMQPKGYIHINTEFKESLRFRPRSDKGSRGRLLTDDGEIMFEGRCLSSEGPGPIARSIYSEASSPTRAARSPPASRQDSFSRSRQDSFSRRNNTSSADDEIVLTGRSLSTEDRSSIPRALSSQSPPPTRGSRSPPATRQESSFRRRAETSSMGDGSGSVARSGEGPGSIARSRSSESSSPTRAASSSPLATSRRPPSKKFVPVRTFLGPF